MAIATDWGSWQECPKIASMWGSCPRTTLWWFTWKSSPTPPLWTYWGHCWSRRRMMPWHEHGTHRPPLSDRHTHRSRRSVTTNSCPLTKGMMGTRSALPNWMLPHPGWCQRMTLHHWVTQWTPLRRGTMMDSSLVSAKPLRLANTRVVVASTVRRRAIVGANARRPFPRAPGDVRPTG